MQLHRLKFLAWLIAVLVIAIGGTYLFAPQWLLRANFAREAMAAHLESHSVQAGDTLAALHRPGEGARFWHQGQPSGEIRDPELARAFFAIWLDPRTREPQLRAQLLGLADGGR